MRRRSVNFFICRKIRGLRRAHLIGVRQMARLLDVPPSTYADLENGDVRLHLDELHGILGVLDADINEVWPGVLSDPDFADSQNEICRLQEFRLSEVVALSDGDGAALFASENRRWRTLMSFRLPRATLSRIRLCLEEKGQLPKGFWLGFDRDPIHLRLFLKASSAPRYVCRLAETYLSIWSRLYVDKLLR